MGGAQCHSSACSTFSEAPDKTRIVGDQSSSSSSSKPAPRCCWVCDGRQSPSQREAAEALASIGDGYTRASSRTPAGPPGLTARMAGSMGVRVLKDVLESHIIDSVARKDLEFVRYAMEGLLLPHVPLMKMNGCYMNDDQDPFSAKKSVTLDPETSKYLAHLSGRPLRQGRPKFAHVAQAVRTSIRWKKATENANLKKPAASFLEPVAHQWLNERLDKWSGFNVFLLEDLTCGHPLQAVTYSVFKRRALFDKFSLKENLVNNYLLRIEDTYRSNPYHNRFHAADVVHASHIFINSGLDGGLSELEQLSVIFAAAIHDAGHPGVTNDFRIAEGDEDAITYNDRGVSENMSLAIAFTALQVRGSNFADVFYDKQKRLMRKTVIKAVLATDMSVHFSNLEMLKAAVPRWGTDVQKWDNKDLLVELAVHAADLSNTCRQPDVAFQWTDRVLEEFFAQGDRERAIGRPISPLCDRYSVSRPGSQVGFIDFIVKPTYTMLGEITEAYDVRRNIHEAIKELAKVRNYWVGEKQKEDHLKKKLADAEALKPPIFTIVSTGSPAKQALEATPQPGPVDMVIKDPRHPDGKRIVPKLEEGIRDSSLAQRRSISKERALQESGQRIRPKESAC